jgi:hypothetical protein
MDTIVITTVSNWCEVPRIRHQVAMQMSRFYKVLYVETPTQWKSWHNTKIEKVEKNITRCTLANHFTLPNKINQYVPFLKDHYEKYLLKNIYKILNNYKDTDFILINFNYDFLQVMRQDIFHLKIYFCNDEFPDRINNKIRKTQLIKREREVAVNADLCLGVSYFLVSKLKRYNNNSYLFLPGHEFNINREKKQVRNGKIKIAFMGYINSRIKFDWLEYASLQKEIEVHLIGPIENNYKTKANVYIKNNLLKLHKPKFGQELQNFLESMDVLVMPYSGFSNPEVITASNKLFSYIAVGKPVVSFNFPNLIKFDYGIIYLADSKESFINQIRKAYIEDSDELRKKRFAIAEKNSWEKRGNELKALIDENLDKKYKHKSKK